MGTLYGARMAAVDLPAGWERVAEGPYAGWLLWHGDPFETLSGPFYFRTDDDGGASGAFVPDDRHRNGHGTVHGGALLTFADAMAGSTALLALDGQHVVTVTLNSEFVGACRPDAPVGARAEIVRATRSMVFVRGGLDQGGEPVLMFSAVLRRITPADPPPAGPPPLTAPR